MKINKNTVTHMLVMKNIAINTMYVVQELHTFS